jgi:hypothetical protein
VSRANPGRVLLRRWRSIPRVCATSFLSRKCAPHNSYKTVWHHDRVISPTVVRDGGETGVLARPGRTSSDSGTSHSVAARVTEIPRCADQQNDESESCHMNNRNERLQQLAVMASNEQDLTNFIALANEINLILKEKEQNLGRLRIPSKPSE